MSGGTRLVCRGIRRPARGGIPEAAVGETRAAPGAVNDGNRCRVGAFDDGNPGAARVSPRRGMSGAGGPRIRDARPDERDAIRALTRAAYAEYAAIMTPATWAGFSEAMRAGLEAEGGVERIVAERDRRLVGSVLLFPPAADAYGGHTGPAAWPELRLLAVAPEARGQGIGRALVAECVHRARRRGAAALGLHTSASMRVAIRMYERLGFVRAPEHDFQPPGAELVTAYRLDL